ncbi:uncharacterized protein BYT42DRAFT_560081 [Radiomyces spectabilis]|uniref:uncharacterized protein n=1 Tax=Radiomyces spectabilis TaxID=64574 RepID=UPI00221F119E|nr:uncharacterized protein BYT42DRAFT_560081 [Radiomyces spectabilis]KAI8388435.1 hypothetical protein BYT42DRAFT_560081 [Radiomyces spectabilis]
MILSYFAPSSHFGFQGPVFQIGCSHFACSCQFFGPIFFHGMTDSNASYSVASADPPFPESDNVVASNRSSQDDFQEPIAIADNEEPRKRKRESENRSSPEDDDEAIQCSICCENWTNNGEHQVVSLKCGHLFGKHCIKRWIASATRKFGNNAKVGCPICMQPARKNDLRVIWPTRITAYDATEMEAIKKELEGTRSRVVELEVEYDRLHLAYQQAIRALSKQASELEASRLKIQSSIIPDQQPVVKIFKDMQAAQLSEERSVSRVMALNMASEIAIVSYIGYGAQKISLRDLSNTERLSIHELLVRDLKCRGDTVLSTGLDKTLKMTSLQNNCVVQTYPLEAAGWSCDFDTQDANLVYCGLQNNAVLVFDIRNTRSHLDRLHKPSATGSAPLHSLISSSIDGQRTLLCANLTRSYCWRWNSDTTEWDCHMLGLEQDGYKPFSLSKSDQNSSILVSLRRSSSVKQVVGHLNDLSFETQWMWEDSQEQKALARSFYFSPSACSSDDFICYANEKDQSISLRNQSGLIQALPSGGSALDIKGAVINNEQMLATLTERRFQLFKYT